MVQQARAMVAKGALGKIRRVQVEYPQKWLTEAQDSKQAAWRSDPARAGPRAFIGTHADYLACSVTGLEAERLAADLQTFVPRRPVDDSAPVLLRFTGRARGMLRCSQGAPGNETALRIRVFGGTGGLEWVQETPVSLRHSSLGAPKRRVSCNGPGAGAAAKRLGRIPPHVEGFPEAFANT